nr:unnamed protein product [Spirometra erinaceieuropaei]
MFSFQSIRSLSSSFQVRTIGSGFVSPVRSYAVNIMQGLIIGSMLRECYYTLDWRWLRTVVVAPCFEELIFRSCILFHLKRELKSLVQVLLTAFFGTYSTFIVLRTGE